MFVPTTVIGTVRLAALGPLPSVVVIVSEQLDGPAPAGVTVNVGAVTPAPLCARPACVMVGQLPVPVIFAASPAALNAPVTVTVCAVFAAACAAVNVRLVGDATSGAGDGLPLGAGPGEPLGTALGEALGASARRMPCGPAAAGAPDTTGAGATAAWPGTGWPGAGCTVVDCGCIPPICWLPVCTGGSEDESIAEHAARSAAVARATKTVLVYRDDNKEPLARTLRGEAPTASLVRR